jgi:uncharacterized protein YjbI with pentapeptide repeats
MASAPNFPYLPALQTYGDDLREFVRSGQVVNFHGFIFKKKVDFPWVAFEKGVVFQRCVFLEEVDFRGAHFRGQGRFWKTVFLKKVDFRWAVFEKREQAAQDDNNSGEANFSWCQFKGDADFYGTKFLGPAYFWRTIFREDAKLEARFDSAVTFEGNQAQFCFERADFGDKSSLFDGMNLGGLLLKDEDDDCCANVIWPDDDDALTARLEKIGFHPDSVKHVKAVVARQRANMFSQKGASFRGSYFARPDIAKFHNLDLQTCRFVGSNAGQAQFQNVRWDSRPTLFGAADRCAVCDESPAGSGNPRATGGERSAKALRALGALYYDLRVNHEGKGLFDEAIDFHYGELETKRLNQSLPLRLVSLTAWYRYLSAYGTRPALALFWLVAAVFVIFPLLFILSGFSHDLLKAILHSLETSTFLETPKISAEGIKDGIPIAAKVVAGFERILVPFQAGLFLFAVQRKFGRK